MKTKGIVVILLRSKMMMLAFVVSFLSVFSCSKDDGSAIGGTKSLSMPANNSGTSLEAIPEGTYKIKDIATYATVTYDGSKARAFFRQVMKTHGDPSKGDEVVKELVGGPGEAEGTFQIAPEAHFPLSVTSESEKITFDDTRYYWNYVRNTGSWKWYLSGSERTSYGGINLKTHIEKALETPDGVYVHGSKTVITQLHGTGTSRELWVFAKWKSSDGEAILRLIYQWSPVEKNRRKAFEMVRKATPSSQEPVVTVPVETLTPPEPKKQIELTQEEREISQAPTSGVFRNPTSGKRTVITNRADLINEGVKLGFSRVVVTHAADLTTHSGGVVGLANSSQQIVDSITDMIGHMKKKMNQNNDGLELVFAIDYSGSMSDNIKAVIDGLKKVSHALSAIVGVGRTVRIGIVTFGKTGRDKTDLAFTEDLSVVRSTLQTLLTNYGTHQHSDNPGEACYGGINCAIDELKWKSQNRQIIVLTDEGSTERANKNFTYIEEVEKKLSSTRIYPVVVKLPY